MNPAAKLAAFVLAMGIATGGAAVVSQAVGPIDSTSDPREDDMDHHQPRSAEAGSGRSSTTHDEDERAEAVPTGVLVSLGELRHGTGFGDGRR